MQRTAIRSLLEKMLAQAKESGESQRDILEDVKEKCKRLPDSIPKTPN